MRKPSAETELRRIRQKMKLLLIDYNEAFRRRDVYLQRAQHAEQEASEWKIRFDLLLKRDANTEAKRA